MGVKPFVKPLQNESLLKNTTKTYRHRDTSHSRLRGVKKNWRDNLPEMSDSEFEYWVKFLKENEKRLIDECCDELD